MRLYYIDESEGPRYYVRSALGVDSDKWNDLFTYVHAWRVELRDRYGIPLNRELHACDLLAGRGLLAKNGDANERLSPQHGAEVFLSGLCRLEATARNLGGIEVINVCLHKPRSRNHEQASLNRLLNRINTSVAAAERHAFLIFDEGREEMISRLYRKLKVRNQVPSRYEAWEDGEKTRDIPNQQIIGGPAFRSSKSDYLLQVADFIAHALLKQEEAPIPRVEDYAIDRAFSILEAALNRNASRSDPQGIVRR